METPVCVKHDEKKQLVGKAQRWKCKSCNREYQANWFQQNKQVQRSRATQVAKEYRKQNRKFLWDYKSGHPCIDCGETDPIVLDFDHLNPDEKSFGIGSELSKHGLSSLKKEIEKCVIRCANCHRRRTAAQLGWYQLEGAT